MFIDYVFWSVLLVIGVSDAQKHRIPNKLVLTLLLVVIVSIAADPAGPLLDHLSGFFIAFTVCLLLYITRVMAAGDVKLLAVVGLWVGVSQLADTAIWIVLAGGMVGVFYLALFLAESRGTLYQNVVGYVYQKATPGSQKTRLVIPFAPVIVIGLALQSYIY
ncbi:MULTISPECIES: A24 family peptidase [unclassified Vibrio]|uniref:A24 family peptidase n=1 Tax=unclassified Vibrio TaxID=2614977 RepID=UPI001361D029|nr:MULTISPECIES: A24 family peptidase [unclassified Vibrio]NAW59250.1 prepilin peptidase [Vibrio sp. V36_P2S2PM302]NAX27497.1 prepilin peptidase [Vibrio sp. V38_P2S17PM301]NAX30679.1 prepilin peptidase [Vibrio sp. V37_P2S8PM304]